MKTEILQAQDPGTLAHALAVLQNGGLVAFPTDTVYGVGALAFNGAAVAGIYTAKDRPVEKAIPVLIGDPADLAKVTLEVPGPAARLAARFWPGPLTLVVPKHPDLPETVSATSAVVRTNGGYFSQSFRPAKPLHRAGGLFAARR